MGEQTKLAGILNTAGLRATKQRIGLLAALESAQTPLSVDALIKGSHAPLDTATAYRTLETLRSAGIVRRIDLSQGRALYERAGTHHHHVVCTKCGRIKDVESCIPASLGQRVKNASGFARIDDHTLEFFGLCAPCAQTT